jgi:hypothetical protein
MTAVGDIEFFIHEGQGTSGTVLASGSETVGSTGFYDIPLSGVHVDAGSEYTIALERGSGTPEWGYKAAGSYSGESSLGGTNDFTLKTYIKPDEYNYYYISENDDEKLYLENKEGYTTPTDGAYTSRLLWFYVKTAETIEYLNALWNDDNQIGMIPGVELYVVGSKEV